VKVRDVCLWHAGGRLQPGSIESDDVGSSREQGETKLSEEYERWEARYSAPDYIFGKEPNYFLAKSKHLLPKSGRALAVADGEGRNSVWLAEQGFDVHAIDFSPAGYFYDIIAEAIAAQRFPAWTLLALTRKCHETCGCVTFREICVGCF
jgi:hypothetical protein